MTGTQQNLDQDIAALRNRLERSGISTAEWGKGEAKTLANLVKELQEGDSSLVEENGKLVRTVIVGGADVFYETPEGSLRLKEEKQVFQDGRERRRDLGSAVSEKIRPDEAPAEAMLRGLREELGITGEVTMRYEGESGKTITSPSYPGLTSRYVNHKFTAVLSADQFKPKGYIEVQDDKTTYFVWQPVEAQQAVPASTKSQPAQQAKPTINFSADVMVSTASAIVRSKSDPYRILVAKSAKHKFPVIPGGKVERSDISADAETPGLSCVVREVEEEIGTKLLNPHYLGKATDPDRDIRVVPAKKVAEAVVEPQLPSDISEDAMVRAHYGCPDYIFVGEVDESAISKNTEELSDVQFIDIRDLQPGELSAGHDVVVLTYRAMLDAGKTQFPEDSLRFFNLEREEFLKK
jgi:8-oxo-dGTP pyrophosphatase MutT (NUDIX family)